MTDTGDTNAAIWKSETGVQHWLSTVSEREAKRRAQWRLMGELLPIGDDDEFTFADLGSGTGAAARAILDLYPRSSAALGEYSEQMIAEGTKAMAPYTGRYRYVRFDLNAGTWPSEMPSALPAIVTSMCVHHLPDERKRALFAEIADHLLPGGWYLNLDPVRSDDPAITAAWTRANDREDPAVAKKARKRSAQELLQHENHIRHIAPLDMQLSYLREAGLTAVDTYWRQCDMVIFGGMRPIGHTP